MANFKKFFSIALFGLSIMAEGINLPQKIHTGEQKHLHLVSLPEAFGAAAGDHVLADRVRYIKLKHEENPFHNTVKIAAGRFIILDDFLRQWNTTKLIQHPEDGVIIAFDNFESFFVSTCYHNILSNPNVTNDEFGGNNQFRQIKDIIIFEPPVYPFPQQRLIDRFQESVGNIANMKRCEKLDKVCVKMCCRNGELLASSMISYREIYEKIGL